MEYRHELKYVCTRAQLRVIKSRLSALMKNDKNADKDGKYNIRSVYFDDIYDSCMHENAAGLDNRQKVRIRVYNADDSKIKLEIKYKDHGMTKKVSSDISRRLCDELTAGRDIPFCCLGKDNALNLMYLYKKTKYIMPKVIVEYDRTVFVEKAGNVRVTFDENIRCSGKAEKLFDKSIDAVPVMNSPNQILEVKYDELLPGYIHRALNDMNLVQTAFSKYYLSRLALRGDYYDF